PKIYFLMKNGKLLLLYDSGNLKRNSSFELRYNELINIGYEVRKILNVKTKKCNDNIKNSISKRLTKDGINDISIFDFYEKLPQINFLNSSTSKNINDMKYI